MRRFPLIALVTALSAASPVLAVTYASYAFKKQYTVDVSQERLDKSPAWLEDSENPPLSARKAIKLATELKDSLVKDSKDFVWQLTEASLVPDKDQKWYWLVKYEARLQGGGSTGQPPMLRLVVMMDGSVIQPVVRDRP